MRIKPSFNWMGMGVILVALALPAGLPADMAFGKDQNPVDKKDVSAAKIRWHSYEEGISRAKREGKKVFLNFYADWCHYCQVMEAQTFRNNAVAAYLNDHYIPVQVNSDKQLKIVKEYEVEGLPTTFFIAEDGNTIGSQPGYIPPDIMLPLLKFIDTNSYKKMDFKTFQERR